MELSDLRKLQLLEVNLLHKFQEICKENNLTYYFTGGGLIGALRHGGFIPWDDDMDIVMPRVDYDRFVEICKKGVDDNYKIESDWNFILSRFVDEESLLERPSAFNSLREKVWIDVFPIDGMPKQNFRRWLHMKHALMLRYLLILTDTERLAGKKKRPIYETIILSFFNIIPVFKILDKQRMCCLLEKCMKKYNYNESEYCCNLIGRYRSREIQPRQRWGTPATLLFEGVEVKVPQQYHEFQTHIYGNYMKLPPENERVAHEAKLIKSRAIDFEKLEKQSMTSQKKI